MTNIHVSVANADATRPILHMIPAMIIMFLSPMTLIAIIMKGPVRREMEFTHSTLT